MNKYICSNKRLPCEKKPVIMGILNITPDSFSDGGKYSDEKSAYLHAEKLIDEGADILDLGAVSTRPYSESVSSSEEWERLQSPLKRILREFDIPVSVDTFNHETAKKCLDLGVSIINDVSGVFSQDMASAIKQYDAGWIVMHGGVGIQKTETVLSFYDGIISDINSFFAAILKQIKDFGISENKICLDPGFGFAKDINQNLELLENFHLLQKGSASLMCALSKKRFTEKLAFESELPDRANASLRANLTAIKKGADIIRVHDVLLHKNALK